MLAVFKQKQISRTSTAVCDPASAMSSASHAAEQMRGNMPVLVN